MMIDSTVLSKMKSGSFLISLGRGGVVDELALYNALSEGSTLIGAALDVHENEGEGTTSPLVGLSSVILTPHIGASVAGTQREIGLQIQEIVDSLKTRASQKTL
jgi:phosphoglycerate dehydrogenase-like enzyme